MGAVQGAMLEITPVPELEFSRHDIGTACHADRGADVMAVKDHSLSREGIKMRGLHFPISITPHRVGALIVREQENDIGLPLSSLGSRCAGNWDAWNTGQKQKHELHIGEDGQRYRRRSDQELPDSASTPYSAPVHEVLSLDAPRQVPYTPPPGIHAKICLKPLLISDSWALRSWVRTSP